MKFKTILTQHASLLFQHNIILIASPQRLQKYYRPKHLPKLHIISIYSCNQFCILDNSLL